MADDVESISSNEDNHSEGYQEYAGSSGDEDHDYAIRPKPTSGSGLFKKAPFATKNAGGVLQIGVSVALKNQQSLFTKAPENIANAKFGSLIKTEQEVKKEFIKHDPDSGNDGEGGDAFISTLLHSLGCKWVN